MRIKILFSFILMILSGCGGGAIDSSSSQSSVISAAISGKVSGMVAGGTVLLTNNKSETIALHSDGNFSFSKKINQGKEYNVSLLTQPTGRLCTISNGTGIVSQQATEISNINVSCTEAVVAIGHFNVAVTVSGLKEGNTVSFKNNSVDTLIANDNTLFVFPVDYFKTVIYSGLVAGYSVTIQEHPRDQTCMISNPSGSIDKQDLSDFINLQVICK